MLPQLPGRLRAGAGTRLRHVVAAASLALLAACASTPAATPAAARPSASASRADCRFLQPYLDSVRTAGRFPGATLGVAFADGSSCAIATGWSDTARRAPMTPDHLLLAGSVGKTYFAAVALQLAAEGRLRLDEPIATYLAREPWLDRLPNARSITVRQLLNHTSGLVRYEFQPRFQAALTANPDSVWTPEARLAFLFGATPPFSAGEGWDYSDTNYIVLGLIIERITGRAAYDEIRDRLTAPLGLARTVPADRRVIPGLSQGYAGPGNPFGGTDAMILPDGRLAVNPQFEWAGGGFAVTADDLARWMLLVHQGRAFPDSLLPQVRDGRDASRLLGPGVRYGLATIIRPTPAGISYGHSGFFPGYVTDVRWWPDLRVSVALQLNTSVAGALGRPTGEVLTEVARRAVSRARTP